MSDSKKNGAIRNRRLVRFKKNGAVGDRRLVRFKKNGDIEWVASSDPGLRLRNLAVFEDAFYRLRLLPGAVEL